MALVSPPRGSNKKPKTPACRKARQDKVEPSKEEDERRRIRRERNKIAAAKCRNRRRELIDTLQAETEQLEDEKSILQSEIDELLKEKERLEQVLSAHGSSCKLRSKADEDEEDMAVPSPKGAGIPAAAIFGNSDLFPSAGVQDDREESPQEPKDDLDDLVPSLETEGATSEAAAGAFVPDIADPSAPLCPPDWETLYKSVADDLECLGAPSYVGVFSFNLAETGGFEDDLNSPTLLAL